MGDGWTLQDIWACLKDPANRETLTWIGGAVVGVFAACWAGYRALRPKPPVETPGSGARTATADNGGVAVAGDVSGSTITNGKNQERTPEC